MTAPVLKRLAITFLENEAFEYAVTYAHTDELPNPGTRGRTTRAATLARRGLEAALEGLEPKSACRWGGFGTNTRQSTDKIIVERKEQVS